MVMYLRKIYFKPVIAVLNALGNDVPLRVTALACNFAKIKPKNFGYFYEGWHGFLIHENFRHFTNKYSSHID